MQVLRKAFKQPLDPVVTDFVTSIDADEALASADLKGSMAHAAMLARQGLISDEQASELIDGLKQIEELLNNGKFKLKAEHEDVHMNVEKKLEEIIGETALRLHTARSRNDQVALDLRIYIVEQIESITALIEKLKQEIANLAAKHKDVVMPGYTHLNRAQPVLFAHAMMAFYEMLNRDIWRFADAKKRASVSPLGAGAQAGSSLPIDPHLTAEVLGFSKVFANSIDAVSDRDFAADFLMACCLTAEHLSQLAETLIIWSTTEFGFIKFPDKVTTSSSLMPQKKNPDPVEIVRGKTGIAIGELVNLLVTLKALPLGYNRDLQETKPPVIRAAASVSQCLAVMTVVIESMEVNAQAMKSAAIDPDLMATDLVEYLVKKGVAFRSAHEAVAELVQLARDKECTLSELNLSDFKKASLKFDADVSACFDPLISAQSKESHGGTGKESVTAQLVAAIACVNE